MLYAAVTRQSNASAARMPSSTARRLTTGSTPGIPWQTGHVWLFGGAPKVVGQPQNIFDRVRSCAWTSRPMTVSIGAGAAWSVLTVGGLPEVRYGTAGGLPEVRCGTAGGLPEVRCGTAGGLPEVRCGTAGGLPEVRCGTAGGLPEVRCGTAGGLPEVRCGTAGGRPAVRRRTAGGVPAVGRGRAERPAERARGAAG